MKLRNKKTGEIVVFGEGVVDLTKIGCKNVAEMMEAGWEDYEPKVVYYISWDGMVLNSADKTGWQNAKAIGNYFETEEEAEKAVEKLKAWKRLKDKGFDFAGVFTENGVNEIDFEISNGEKWNDEQIEEFEDDLQLLFGGEE
jgi:hypothetical protein